MTNAVIIAQQGSNNTTFRNRIINGAMVIDQRNAGASVTPTTGQYLVDRWAAGLTAASKFTVQQNASSVTLPAGFINYLGATSSSAYTPLAASDSFYIRQPIEGLNIYDLAWGTASAATVTLSFWVRSSLTGTFGGSLTNSAANRSYPFSYTISSANTWEQKSITIAGDTSGTWLTTNGVGIYVHFSLGTGTTYSGTAGAWAGTTYISATGATSVVGTNGATFYITGVQLEAGSTASPFENRSYGVELALCQRYYSVINSNYSLGYTAGNTVTQGGGMYNLKVSMRIAPSIDSAKPGAYTVSGGSAGTVGLQYSTTESVNLQNASTNWTSTNTVYLSSNLGLTSEL
jgi:hypothetical protein